MPLILMSPEMKMIKITAADFGLPEWENGTYKKERSLFTDWGFADMRTVRPTGATVATYVNTTAGVPRYYTQPGTYVMPELNTDALLDDLRTFREEND